MAKINSFRGTGSLELKCFDCNAELGRCDIHSSEADDVSRQITVVFSAPSKMKFDAGAIRCALCVAKARKSNAPRDLVKEATTATVDLAARFRQAAQAEDLVAVRGVLETVAELLDSAGVAAKAALTPKGDGQ